MFFAKFADWVHPEGEEGGPPVREPFTSVARVYSEIEDMGNAPQSIQAALASVAQNGSEGMDDAAVAVIEDVLAKAHQAMNYTEISKLNGYVDSIQTQEMRRINETHESMANNLLLTQRMYLMQNRETDRLSARIRLLLYTMLTICAVFALMPFAGSPAGMVLMGLILVVYLAGVLIHYRNSRLRRYDDWNKLYWRSDINAASMVTPADDADPDAGECNAGGLLSDVAPAPSTATS